MQRIGRIAVVVLVWAAFCGGVAPKAEAGSLAGDLDQLFGSEGITLDVRPINPQFPPHTAHFQSATLQALGLLTAQLAAQASDFPAISSVPGFTYQYNPNLQVFEPVRGSLGSVYVERPQTLGRGIFDFGASYAYVNFKQLDGNDLDRQSFVLHHNDCCGGPNTPDFPAFEDDTIQVTFNKFELESNVISVFGTYGITDRIDLNVLLPIVYTSLHVDSIAQIMNTTQPPVHFFNNQLQTTQESRSIHDDHFGPGDLQMRGKIRLPDLAGVPVAAGMAMRFPTGSQDNFQGFGDFTFTPFIAAAKDMSQFNVHGSTGFEIDPQHSARTRYRYGGGVTWQPIERAALIVDLIGSLNLTSDNVEVDVPQFDQNGQPIGTQVATQSVSTSIIDIAPGLKVNLFGSAVGFFTAFVPLNSDGLRANFIPTGGVEMSF